MSVRRVVTGHDVAGKAVVVSDEAVEPFSPRFAPRYTIWASDEVVELPDEGAGPEFVGPLIPMPGGFHVLRLTFPAGFNSDAMFDVSDPVEAAERAREQLAASVAIVDDPNPPGVYGTLPGFTGMHATASVDCLMQLAGESVCVLEDTEIRLKPGDWIVLNGVVHAWRNDGDADAVLVGVVVGAEHAGAPLRTG
ncbi:hypothetical protein [Spirillospora sp. NPDC047279]|uniref:hypothetical protein n=1 Tax=Spirillospora sp. NPDC047279 TaxID=3155478 RepID=UPI0033D5D2E8